MKKFILYPVFAILSLFIVACSDHIDSPEGVTNYFIESIYKGNGDALVKSLDPSIHNDDPEIHQILVKEMYDAAQMAKAESQNNGGIQSIKITSIQYTNTENTSATVKFIVLFNKNNAEDIGSLITIKTNKGWKVVL